MCAQEMGEQAVSRSVEKDLLRWVAPTAVTVVVAETSGSSLIGTLRPFSPFATTHIG
jgi:hypothetical protein